MIWLQNPSSITFDQTFFGRDFFKDAPAIFFSPKPVFQSSDWREEKRSKIVLQRPFRVLLLVIFITLFFEHNWLLLRYCCFSAHQKTQPRRKFQIYGRTRGVQIPWELYLAVFLFRGHFSAQLDFAGTHLHQFSSQWAQKHRGFRPAYLDTACPESPRSWIRIIYIWIMYKDFVYRKNTALP